MHIKSDKNGYDFLEKEVLSLLYTYSNYTR